MSRDKYDGKLTDALINTVIRAELRQWVREIASDSRLDDQTSLKSTPGVTAGQPDEVVDYATEFDQSRHAVSIEESREQSVGCYERDDDTE